MKNFNRLLGGAVALSLLLSLVGPVPVSALVTTATTPSLGQAESYGVIGGTYDNPVGPTTINGDVGFTTAPAVTPLPLPRPSVTYPNYGDTANDTAQARLDLAAALGTLNATVPGCDFTFAPGAIDLATDVTNPNGVGIYTPGVYCSTGAMTVGAGGPFAGITLNGAGTYIFRTLGVSDALTSVAGSQVILNGASACDVFWTPTAATTLAANTTFAGTIIDNANAITIGDSTVVTGRALSLGAGIVHTPNSNVTINVPVCATSVPPPSSGGRNYNITVIKQVVNDNGRTNTIADFPLFINGLPVSSGVVNSLPVPTVPYVVTETSNVNYTRTFSGACDVNGVVNMEPGDTKVCVITNDDIGAAVIVPPVPPLIDVVKVASPLSIPVGPGAVTYTYTLRNIGTVPVTNVTMVGDTCSPIVRTSGDINNNNILEVSETWVHTCSTTLASTHTNTVVATAWANGISVSDYASATVVVGAAIVPPLIHITKVPSPLTLLAGGGLVTYRYTVTNPGTEPLSNVFVTDDKCTGLPGRVIGHPGDLNNNNLLESNEAWQFTCQSTLTRTTTNVGTASGEANGLTATDFAVANVIVATAVPVLPKTGFGPAASVLPLVAGVAGIMAASVLLYILRKKQSV